MLDALLASGEVDAVLVVPVATGVTDGAASMAAIARARARTPTSRPWWCRWAGCRCRDVEGP